MKNSYPTLNINKNTYEKQKCRPILDPTVLFEIPV